jgi:hypothetical protein
MTYGERCSLGVVLFMTCACVQHDTVTEREAEFRKKAECSVAAERFDRVLKLGTTNGQRAAYLQEPWVSEVFYSPSRNSCICHVSIIDQGAEHTEFLQDCFTRETLATHLSSAPNASEQAELFKQTDRDLRADPAK